MVDGMVRWGSLRGCGAELGGSLALPCSPPVLGCGARGSLPGLGVLGGLDGRGCVAATLNRVGRLVCQCKRVAKKVSDNLFRAIEVV